MSAALLRTWPPQIFLRWWSSLAYSTWWDCEAKGMKRILGTPMAAMGTGWWFGTFFYFPCHIWDVILPIDELIFFKMVETTNQGKMAVFSNELGYQGKMCKTSSRRTGWSGEPLMMKISAGKPLSRWSRTSNYGPWKSKTKRVTFTPLQSRAKPLQFHFARYRETEGGRENWALIHTRIAKGWANVAKAPSSYYRFLSIGEWDP